MPTSRSFKHARVDYFQPELVKEVKQSLKKGFSKAGTHGRRELKVAIKPHSPSGRTADGQDPLTRHIKKRVKVRRRSVALRLGVQSPYGATPGGLAFAKYTRLDRGFVGTDRAGRVVHQKPRHVFNDTIAREQDEMMRLIVAEGFGQ